MSGLSGEAVQESVEDLEAQIENVEVVEENQEPEHIVKAKELGWKPKEEYKGDPEDWRPAKQFLEWGSMIEEQRNLKNQMKGMKKNYNKDIEGLNLLHKAQLEMKEKEVIAKFDRAVEDGDKTAANAAMKEHGDIQKQMSNLVKTEGKDPELVKAEWEMKNEFIFDESDPRTKFANVAYKIAMKQGMGIEEALDFVDQRIAEKFSKKSEGNPNRFGDPDTVTSKGGGKRESKITLAQVTPAEMKLREVFASDEDFLKAVSNSRKGV